MTIMRKLNLTKHLAAGTYGVIMLASGTVICAQPPQFPPRPPAYDFGNNRSNNQAPFDNRPDYNNGYQANEPNRLAPDQPNQMIPPPPQPNWEPGNLPSNQNPYADRSRDPYDSGNRPPVPPQTDYAPQAQYPPPNPYAPRGNYPPINPYTQQQPRPPGLPPARLAPPPSGFRSFEQPLLLQHHSLCYIPETPPQEIHVHDIVTIVVKEISEVSVDSRFNRSRRGSLLAEIGEFIRFSEDGNLTNAAENSPAIDGTLNARLDATGRVLESEEIVYRIAATVVDVLPNGNLVLEARKAIESNGDAWEYTLTGTVRSVDINRDNTALSENIANLNITKTLAGRVKDSTRRAWGVRILDFIFPF